MDDSLLKIIIFGAIILFSIVNSIISGNKKKKGQGRNAHPAPAPPQAQEIETQADDDPFYWLNEPQQQPRQAPFLVTTEGQRSTAQRPSKYTPLAKAAPATVLSPNQGEGVAPAMAPVSSPPRPQPLIKSKDDLRRAIILGEALAPKF